MFTVFLSNKMQPWWVLISKTFKYPKTINFWTAVYIINLLKTNELCWLSQCNGDIILSGFCLIFCLVAISFLLLVYQFIFFAELHTLRCAYTGCVYSFTIINRCLSWNWTWKVGEGLIIAGFWGKCSVYNLIFTVQLRSYQSSKYALHNPQKSCMKEKMKAGGWGWMKLTVTHRRRWTDE